MNKTCYYTDKDFENFMARTEFKLRNQFFVCLIASIICQSGLWYVLLSEVAWGVSAYILAGISVLALLCLIGLGYCYYSARRNRLDFERMRREQQAEMNALVDEIQKARRSIS